MKKSCKRLLAVLMAAALAVSAVPVNVQAAAAPKLSVSKKTVYVGDKLTLKVKNQPKGAAVTWASSNKKVAQVTKKGVVKAVKAGTAKVTAMVKTKAVKSAKAKTYKLSCKLTVKGTSVTVRTQTALKGALKNKKIKKITIKTSLARKFTIPKGTYSKVDLVVDAPKADVENSGVFKSITIKSIKPDTFTEKAKGNRFYIPAAAARLVVAEGAIVSDISVSNDASAGTQSVTIVVQSDANVAKVSLEEKTNAQVIAQKNASVNKVEVASKAKAEIVAEADAAVSEVAVQGKDASVAVVANGTVGKVSVQATASVAISGSAKEVPVTVAKEAAGTTVSASVPVNIEASADVKVELAAGAEGSKVKTDSASVSVEVKNGTTTKTEVTTPAGTKEVGAGQSTTVKDNTPNAADTPSTPGYTDTPSYPSNPSTPSNPNTPAETHEYASNNYQKVTKEVAYGTSVTSAQAIAVLPEKIELTDKGGTKAEASVTWNWDAYKTDVAGTYTITGTFALPTGWTGTVTTLEASVTVQAQQQPVTPGGDTEKPGTDTPDTPEETKITLDKTELTLSIDKPAELTATITPNTDGKTVTWTSSDDTVATVAGTGSNATVTGIKRGTATVTAAVEGKTATCTVTVQSSACEITEFTVGNTKATIGDDNKINVTFDSVLTEMPAVSITVSEGATVSPESGSVLPLDSSAATYTVTAEDGITKEYTLYVTFNLVEETKELINSFAATYYNKFKEQTFTDSEDGWTGADNTATGDSKVPNDETVYLNLGKVGIENVKSISISNETLQDGRKVSIGNASYLAGKAAKISSAGDLLVFLPAIVCEAGADGKVSVSVTDDADKTYTFDVQLFSGLSDAEATLSSPSVTTTEEGDGGKAGIPVSEKWGTVSDAAVNYTIANSVCNVTVSGTSVSSVKYALIGWNVKIGEDILGADASRPIFRKRVHNGNVDYGYMTGNPEPVKFGDGQTTYLYDLYAGVNSTGDQYSFVVAPWSAEAENKAEITGGKVTVTLNVIVDSQTVGESQSE